MKYSIYFNMKPWYKSVTVWVAIGQALLGVLAEISTADPTLHLAGSVVILKSVIDVLLRFKSVEPLA